MGRTSQRGYGRPYQRARAALLADNPTCHWCPAPATTADHDPPIEAAGAPHLRLVPACEKCNYGRRSRIVARPAGPSRPW
jgi:5-methylcytosine-specific restriction endonuclease McrA